MIEKNRILRCPFCGGAEILFFAAAIKGIYAECENCGARGPLAIGEGLNDDDRLALAAEKWNHRPPSVTLDSFPPFPPGYCDTCGRNSDHISVATDCPIEHTYALPRDGYCHLYERYNPIKWGDDSGIDADD